MLVMEEGEYLLVSIFLLSITIRIGARKCGLDPCREDLDLIGTVVKQTT